VQDRAIVRCRWRILAPTLAFLPQDDWGNDLAAEESGTQASDAYAGCGARTAFFHRLFCVRQPLPAFEVSPEAL
jgi:hypothetical protein